MIAPTLKSTSSQTEPAAESFFGEIPALVCVIGSDGRLMRVNEAWSDILGHSVRSLVAKPFATFFHAEDIPLLEARLTRCGPNETSGTASRPVFVAVTAATNGCSGNSSRTASNTSCTRLPSTSRIESNRKLSREGG